jgi:tetratricopeptide (TPR) repeat protein
MKKLPLFCNGLLILLLLCGFFSCLSPYQYHLARAAAAISKTNNNEAIIEFTKVIEIAPNDATGYYWRGTCYYDMAQYDLAINDFSKAIKLNQKSPDSEYNYRGLSYSAKGEYDSAISDFTKAIEIDQHPLTYNNRGLAYNGIKNYDLAIKDFTEAINIMTKDARPYSNRADSYIAIGQNSLAIADLRKTIKLAHDDLTIMKSAKESLTSLGVTE